MFKKTNATSTNSRRGLRRAAIACATAGASLSLTLGAPVIANAQPALGPGLLSSNDPVADIRQAVDDAVNSLLAEPVVPAAPAAAPRFDTGSCPAEARACVDLEGGRAWLQRDGQVSYGAVPMSAGAPGWETPRGTHYVTRKVKDEVSYQFNLAPMPYSVYFTNDGVAFHEGDVNVLSHGCIHLNSQDAQVFYNDLQVGDMVYVY